MNLLEAVQTMSILNQPTEENVKFMLEDGYHVVVADKNNYGDNLLKYDLFVEDDILIISKMSDSTREEIVLTPESIARFTNEYFHILWASYLSGKDVFYLDTSGFMHDARMRLEKLDFEKLKKQLGDKDVIYIEDPYSPFER